MIIPLHCAEFFFFVFQIIFNYWNPCLFFIIQLPEKLTVEVGYRVGEVVFPIGRAVDPVTGRRCRGTRFIDDQARKEEATRITTTKISDNYPL